jgi:hypothetical protein
MCKVDITDYSVSGEFGGRDSGREGGEVNKD